MLAGCVAPRTGTQTATPPDAPHPTATGGTAAEDLLPRATGEWTLVRTDEYDWRTIGGADGVRGHYTDADGVAYQVVIMAVARGDPQTRVAAWTCEVGWTVGLAHEEFAVVAGTGTARRTFTPERPPTMTSTPVPGTTDRVLDLLANSPTLTRSAVEAHATTREECEETSETAPTTTHESAESISGRRPKWRS